MTQAATGIFSYQAQTADGQNLSGQIEASNIESARQKLEALGLRLTKLIASTRSTGESARQLGTSDFLAFNQELASLAQAGLPVEQGLRLIAQDLRSGRLATAVNELAADLENGTPLAQAFEKHRGQFPPLYGKLIDAGVKSSNLPGVLLNLNQHVQTMQRLRRALWSAFAYPIALMVVLFCVCAFMGLEVLPQFEVIFHDFHASLPGITLLFLMAVDAMPVIVTAVLIAVFLLVVAVLVLRWTGRMRYAVDYVVAPLPVVGMAVRKNLIARWCSAMRLGIEAGLDIPAAMELAAQSVDSPRLQHDTQRLIEALANGRKLDTVQTELLPPILPAAIELGASRGDLMGTLAALSQMNQRQADLRISAIPVTVVPIVLIGFGFIVTWVVLALFAPMISLIQSMSGNGGSHHWWW